MIKLSEKESEEKKYRETADDSGFKSILHDSRVLTWFIRSNVDEFKDRSIDEIKACMDLGEDGRTVIGRDTELSSPKNGKIRMDSIFELKVPDSDEKVALLINIEGQRNPRPGYPLGKRAEYYAARLVSSQKGVYFKGDDYGKMRKVYSIWYILKPRLDDRNTVITYGMTAKDVLGNPGQVPDLDTFNIVMVNVGSYDDALPDASALPALLFNNMDDDEREGAIWDRFNIEYDDVLRKEVNDMASITQDSYDWGYDEGLAKGRAEGRAEGMAEGMANIISCLSDTVISLTSDKGWPLDEALAFMKVSDDLKAPLEEEVRRRLK